ncbi:MAG: hypothetical protein GY852_07195, partial [bacterium]|nr:hypothetical protein [bacterium]
MPTAAAGGLPFQTQPAPPPQQTPDALPFMQPQAPAEPQAPTFVQPQPQQPQEGGLPSFQTTDTAKIQYEETSENSLPPLGQPVIIGDPVPQEPRTGTFGLQATEVDKAPMGFQIGSDAINPPMTPANIAQFPVAEATETPENKEQRQAQDEAKRFARLLILEIKL